jgi:hypothetical protein
MEEITYQGVPFGPELRPEWSTREDWITTNYLSTEKWSLDYHVAVLGDGTSFHRPQLSMVRGKRRVSGNPKWEVLHDLGIEHHLSGECVANFWSINWVLRPVGLLMGLAPLRNLPYMPCNNCRWGPLLSPMQDDLNLAPVRRRAITKTIQYIGNKDIL